MWTQQSRARWLGVGFVLGACSLTPVTAAAEEPAQSGRRVLVYPVSAQANVPKRIVGQLNELLQKLGAGEAGLDWVTVPQLAKVVKKPRPLLAPDLCQADVSCWAGLGAQGAAQEVIFGRVGLVAGKLTVALIVVDVATSSMARRVVLNTEREQLASDLAGSRDELLGSAATGSAPSSASAAAMTIDPADASNADAAGVTLEPLATSASASGSKASSSTSPATVGVTATVAAAPAAVAHASTGPGVVSSGHPGTPEPVAAADRAARAVASPPVETTASAGAVERSRLWFGAGVSATGVGAVLVGVGAYFASSASSAYDDAKGAGSQVAAADARVLGDQRTERANAFLFAGTAALTAGAAALIYDWVAGGD